MVFVFFVFGEILWGFFVFVAVVFQHRICVFIVFSSVFDEGSNFHNRKLTNQNYELVVSNSQHSHKKQKYSLEKRAVDIEIPGLCWNLACVPSHRGSSFKKHGLLWSRSTSWFFWCYLGHNRGWYASKWRRTITVNGLLGIKGNFRERFQLPANVRFLWLCCQWNCMNNSLDESSNMVLT